MLEAGKEKESMDINEISSALNNASLHVVRTRGG